MIIIAAAAAVENMREHSRVVADGVTDRDTVDGDAGAAGHNTDVNVHDDNNR